jgi:hypothetical protein
MKAQNSHLYKKQLLKIEIPVRFLIIQIAFLIALITLLMI